MNRILYILMMILALGLVACDNGTEADTTAEEATATEQVDEATGEEAPTDGEGSSSERLSPPKTSTGNVGNAEVTVNYSAPSKRGRTVWGQVVPYGQVWRTGANEATTFETSQDLLIQGERLPAGRYALFTIPTRSNWTIIFNEEPDQWGAFEYDESRDALRVEVTPMEVSDAREQFGIQIANGGLMLAWDQMRIPVSMEAAQ